MDIKIDLANYLDEYDLKELCEEMGMRIVESQNLRKLTLIEESNLNKFLEVFRKMNQLELEEFLNKY